MYYGTVHWPTVVCGEVVCECWYDHLSVVLLCMLSTHTQDRELYRACGYHGGRLENAQSAIKRGAVVCGEVVCECWYDHLSVVLLCMLSTHTQD